MIRVESTDLRPFLWLGKVYLDLDISENERLAALGYPIRQDVRLCLYEQVSGGEPSEKEEDIDKLFRLLAVSEPRELVLGEGCQRKWTSFRFPWVRVCCSGSQSVSQSFRPLVRQSVNQSFNHCCEQLDGSSRLLKKAARVCK